MLTLFLYIWFWLGGIICFVAALLLLSIFKSAARIMPSAFSLQPLAFPNLLPHSDAGSSLAGNPNALARKAKDASTDQNSYQPGAAANGPVRPEPRPAIFVSTSRLHLLTRADNAFVAYAMPPSGTVIILAPAKK